MKVILYMYFASVMCHLQYLRYLFLHVFLDNVLCSLARWVLRVYCFFAMFGGDLVIVFAGKLGKITLLFHCYVLNVILYMYAASVMGHLQYFRGDLYLLHVHCQCDG